MAERISFVESLREPKTREGLERFEKFTKEQAYYGGARFPPFIRCENCWWFFPPDKCKIVSSKGTPTPGKILPKFGCSLFLSTGLRIRWWQIKYGRGPDEKGIFPEVIRRPVLRFIMERQEKRFKERGIDINDGQPPAYEKPEKPKADRR